MKPHQDPCSIQPYASEQQTFSPASKQTTIFSSLSVDP
jgi:hypothetical protein